MISLSDFDPIVVGLRNGRRTTLSIMVVDWSLEKRLGQTDVGDDVRKVKGEFRQEV